MILALAAAFLAPVFLSVMNVVDKYVISRRVKSTLGFATLVGLVNVLYGLAIGLFVDWTGVSARDALMPIIGGVIFGIEGYFYYLLFEKEDASHMIGLAFLYPVVVAAFSFAFLGERIPTIGYLGVLLTVAGVVLLSVRLSALRLQTKLWMIAAFILLIAAYEFFMKFSVENLSALQGLSLFMGAMGATLAAGLFLRNIRAGFFGELRNAPWAFANESLTVLGSWATFVALTTLPLTITASISAIQPLCVLFLERGVDAFGHRISRDHLLLPKLGAIVLIVAGVALLAYATT